MYSMHLSCYIWGYKSKNIGGFFSYKMMDLKNLCILFGKFYFTVDSQLLYLS